MKEDVIYLLYENWCNSGHEPEVKKAIDKVLKKPTVDNIFQLASIVEADAFKAGARACLDMIHCLFNPDIE